MPFGFSIRTARRCVAELSARIKQRIVADKSASVLGYLGAFCERFRAALKCGTHWEPTIWSPAFPYQTRDSPPDTSRPGTELARTSSHDSERSRRKCWSTIKKSKTCERSSGRCY